MKTPDKHTRKGTRRVTFKFYAPRAKEVQLLGDVNQWGVKPQTMKRNEYGSWKKMTYVFPGTYEYRYLADGIWHCDPANPKRCQNCFGTENSVLKIGHNFYWRGFQ